MTRSQSPTPSHSVNCTDPNSVYQPDRVASILRKFMDDFEYSPTGINHISPELEDYMREVMMTRKIEDPLLKKCLRPMASMVQLCHPILSMDAKKNTALYMWVTLYIEDKALEDPIPFNEFGQRLLANQPQLDPVLSLFVEVLREMWRIYDPMIAALILNGTLQFVAFTCLEPHIKDKHLVSREERFAWYLRDASGICSYGLLGFTKQDGFNAADLIQALPNFSFWFSTVNDLLSFHKEESRGETGTYVWTRAYINNKSPYQTCGELVDELKASREIIYRSMENVNKKAVNVWKDWEKGFVEWHIIQSRYHLKELGFH